MLKGPNSRSSRVEGQNWVKVSKRLISIFTKIKKPKAYLT